MVLTIQAHGQVRGSEASLGSPRPSMMNSCRRLDNLSNQRVATGAGAPSRSLHFLRRYGVLKQRIRSGEVNVQHIPDEQMPADFLTKWIGQKKLDKSIAYATNSRSLNKP